MRFERGGRARAGDRPRPSREERVRRRVLRIGLLLAVLGQLLWSFRPQPSVALTDAERLGRALYEANCATCHGPGGGGTDDGPSLGGSGPAAVDFVLRTGRMPLADPGSQPVRRDPLFTEEEIHAIVAYVGTIQPGGTPIPDVDPSRGSLVEGQRLFLGNCAACHGAGAGGDSVGGGRIAPSLYPASALEIAEALRVGPGTMPRFGPENLSQEDLDSLARYLLFLQEERDPGGLGLGRVGAVTEGFVVLVVGILMVLLILRLTGSGT